jgi:hypothetical protein
MNGCSLISFWIKPADPAGPPGFGVTAWSIEDAVALIEEAGYAIDPGTATIRESVHPNDIDENHAAPNAGPSVFRGVWYPCLNVGWGASGTR